MSRGRKRKGLFFNEICVVFRPLGFGWTELCWKNTSCWTHSNISRDPGMMKHNPTEYNSGIQLEFEELQSEHCFPNTIQTIKLNSFRSQYGLNATKWNKQCALHGILTVNLKAKVFFPKVPAVVVSKEFYTNYIYKNNSLKLSARQRHSYMNHKTLISDLYNMGKPLKICKKARIFLRLSSIYCMCERLLWKALRKEGNDSKAVDMHGWSEHLMCASMFLHRFFLQEKPSNCASLC